MAIPLSLVARLEEFPRSALERAGPQDVVQYRDEILPLIDVSRVLRRRRRHPRTEGRPARRKAAQPRQAADDETVQVVVYSGEGRHVGLVVGRILDIVEETLVSRSPSNRPGVLFTAVVQGRVTEFLDIEGHHPLGRAGILRAAPARRRGGLSHGGRPSILHLLRGRPFLRAGRAQGAGDHPLPGDDRACRWPRRWCAG